MDEFEKLKQEASQANIEPEIVETDRETVWKAKRAKCYITSSVLPKIMTKGRGKGVEWGDTAKEILYGATYQQRTGLQLENKDFWQFKWGNENEPRAIDWLKRNCSGIVKSCSEDFDEIIFNTPFNKFGDSPDFYLGEKIIGEIKCPVDQIKIEKYREIDSIHDKTENYWQFLGHFIGSPERDELWWVIYDGYADEGHIVKMYRKDHIANIERLTARIKDGIYVVDKCLNDGEKIGNVEGILNKRNETNQKK
jgi:hypothetical protein